MIKKLSKLKVGTKVYEPHINPYANDKTLIKTYEFLGRYKGVPNSALIHVREISDNPLFNGREYTIDSTRVYIKRSRAKTQVLRQVDERIKYLKYHVWCKREITILENLVKTEKTR